MCVRVRAAVRGLERHGRLQMGWAGLSCPGKDRIGENGGALGREWHSASGRVGLRYGVLMYAQLMRADGGERGEGWCSGWCHGLWLAVTFFCKCIIDR